MNPKRVPASSDGQSRSEHELATGSIVRLAPAAADERLRAVLPANAFTTSSILGPTPSAAVQGNIVEALIEEGMARFRWDHAGADTDGIASGSHLLAACRSLFAVGSDLESFVCPVPDDRADVGYYRFAVNNPSGGLRAYRDGSHRGLPFSGIWNHRAANNPHWFRLAEEQRIFDRFVGAYTPVVAAISAAFTATVDPERRIESLINTDGRTDGSYLRVIASPGARHRDQLTIRRDGLISRHRAHVDTTVFVVQPPTLPLSTRGGRLRFLDHQSRWQPMQVDVGEFVVFTGRDFNAVLGQARSHKFVHEVVATPEEATCDRLSAFYRVGVDPDATNLRTVGGGVFQTLNASPANNGADYYAAMNIHRSTA